MKLQRSMESAASFSRISLAYLKTCSVGKTSRYLSFGDAGHLSLRGGTLEAVHINAFHGLRIEILPSKASLFPSPYAQAVSKKLHPRSTANCNASSDWRSSEPLQPPIPQSPVRNLAHFEAGPAKSGDTSFDLLRQTKIPPPLDLTSLLLGF